jgi:FemAB-related protein (PEP-CTERM system-associated)
MEVREYDGPGDSWDAFVRGRPGATHMHLHGWKGILGNVLGHETPYLVALDGGELRGVLPLVSVRSRLFGNYLVSMPFLNYGGPLGDEEAVRALVEVAVDMARGSATDLLELRSRRRLPVELPDSARKITVTLPLTPHDSEALWSSFTSKLRNKIKRGLREDLDIRAGRDQLEPFFRVFRHHMRDLGTPTLPRRLFEAIIERFPESSRFVCVYLEGRPAAAGCALTFGDEIEMTWSAALREFNRERPNMALYWGVMELACDEGLARFNFGRCSEGSGTHAFKASWTGAVDEPLHWYYWSPDGRRATPTPDDSSYAWGPRIWRSIPVPIASAIGPRIIRLIP